MASSITKKDLYEYHGKLKAINARAKTFTVQSDKGPGLFVIHVTPKTKILKNGKAATLQDAAIGEKVSGLFNYTADRKLIAVSAAVGERR